MSETKIYTCNSPVNHNGKLYAIAAPIELDDDAAGPLLALGHIFVRQADPAPSNVVNLGDAKKGAGDPADAGKEPSDPAVRQAAIIDSMRRLDVGDEAAWTRAGVPDVKHLSAMLGWVVTAAERDNAWKVFSG